MTLSSQNWWATSLKTSSTSLSTLKSTARASWVQILLWINRCHGKLTMMNRFSKISTNQGMLITINPSWGILSIRKRLRRRGKSIFAQLLKPPKSLTRTLIRVALPGGKGILKQRWGNLSCLERMKITTYHPRLRTHWTLPTLSTSPSVANIRALTLLILEPNLRMTLLRDAKS